MKRHKVNAVSFEHGILAREIAGDRSHFRLGLLERDARFETPDRIVPEAPPRTFLIVVQGHRHPNLGVFVRKLEARRHDADHGARDVAYQDFLAYYVGVAAKSSLPQTVTQNRYPVLSNSFFLDGEDPAPHRGDAENFKQTGRRSRADDPLGFADA